MSELCCDREEVTASTGHSLDVYVILAENTLQVIT